jgi:precorrin-6A/cobalt-precorrin-6A reductase
MDSQRVAGQLAASAMRVLILGGTTEASALAGLVAGDPRFDATLSLAGRTTAPRPQPIATRVGGFGGADGLARFLAEQDVAAVIDATHPYAARMSANAVAACRQAGVPLASLLREAWQARPGDRWQHVATAEAAAESLGPAPRRVFLTLGRQELHAFAAAPQHRYVARLIEPPRQASLPPDLLLLRQRGPFDLAAERRLLHEHGIDVMVSKNAGGGATYAKIEAARGLGVPIIMIARPDKPAGDVVRSAEEAVAWLDHVRAPGSRRGV